MKNTFHIKCSFAIANLILIASNAFALLIKTSTPDFGRVGIILSLYRIIYPLLVAIALGLYLMLFPRLDYVYCFWGTLLLVGCLAALGMIVYWGQGILIFISKEPLCCFLISFLTLWLIINFVITIAKKE